MKTAIVTFPRAINYGTALQAVALQNALEKQGADAFFLDHRCEPIDHSDKLFDIKHIFNPKYTIAHAINFPTAYKRKRNFQKFHKNYMNFYKDDPYAADIVVAGSDQVWNYNLTGDDYYYFLDFPKNNIKKVAYAGSFGLSQIEERHFQKMKAVFADFDALSVREERARELIKEIADVDSTVVLDPTLLLTREDWEKYMAPEKEKGYIFVYTVFNSESLWEYAYKLSKKTGLPIKTISYSRMHKHEAQYDYTAGPDDWLRYMADADYVVTNSFHGCAFSINFEKQFFFELPPAKSGVGSRLSNITARYGLAERELKAADMDEVIDYTKTKELLASDRADSVRFIENFLKV